MTVRTAIPDLERGKFLPGGTYQLSTVRVQPIGSAVTPVESGLNYVFKYFRAGGTISGSREQNINGSVTPQDFSIPIAVRTLMRRLDIVIVSSNDISLMDYGMISGGLSNGVQFIRKSPTNVETVIFNFQRYIEFGHFTDGQINSVEITENPTENIWIASVTFDHMWDLPAGSSLITRVRDDLTPIDYQRTSVVLLEGI